MRLRKKGMFEEQFNWMFVLIAGAVIIFFFFNFLMKQQELSRQKTELMINTEIESIASGVQSAQNTAIEINIPKTTLALDCTRTCQCLFGVKGALDRKPYADKYIFSPSTVPGPKMIVWSKPWEVPYTVSNFLYITSPSIRYVFGYDPDDDTSRAMFNKMIKLWEQTHIDYLTVQLNNDDSTSCQPGGSPSPYRAKREDTTPPSPYVNEEYYKTRFILFLPSGGEFCIPSSFKNADISALTVQGTDFDGGALTFMKKNPADTTTYISQELRYAGTASLLGAVFAEDPLAYYCTMSRALGRVNQSMQVLANRSRMLNAYWQGLGTSAATCVRLHSELHQLLTGQTVNGDIASLPYDNLGIMGSLPPGYKEGMLVSNTYGTFNDGFPGWLLKIKDFRNLNFALNLNSCVEAY